MPKLRSHASACHRISLPPSCRIAVRPDQFTRTRSVSLILAQGKLIVIRASPYRTLCLSRRRHQKPALQSTLSTDPHTKMEAQHPPPSTAAQAREWPAVPTAPPKSATESDTASVMDIDSIISSDTRTVRATSVLSMDDIEAAQALEGLRAGMQSPILFALVLFELTTVLRFHQFDTSSQTPPVSVTIAVQTS